MTFTIRIPDPPFRPGDTPDYGTWRIPAAGEARLPPLDASAEEIVDLAGSLVRVLDDSGLAVGPWAAFLGEVGDDHNLLAGLRDMLRMRAIDDRLLRAQRQGKTSFYLQCSGEEAVGCGFQRLMKPGDMNFPTYRQQPLLVAAGYPLTKLMGQIYSNRLDPTAGRQLPIMHSARDYGYFSISGNLGTQFIQSVGWAMASALSNDDKIAAGWIGEGATATNDFHAALLFAAIYQPPVILNIVNNQWAISTNQSVAGGGADASFAKRGTGYQLPSIRVDGNDFLAVLAVSKWATQRARNNLGPTLIEWLTYRAAAHSTSDDPSAYRPKDESRAWPLGDPVERLKQHLIRRHAWSEERHQQALSEIMDEVTAAQREAEANGTFLAPQPLSPADIFQHVYAEMPPHLRRQRQIMGY